MPSNDSSKQTNRALNLQNDQLDALPVNINKSIYYRDKDATYWEAPKTYYNDLISKYWSDMRSIRNSAYLTHTRDTMDAIMDRYKELLESLGKDPKPDPSDVQEKYAEIVQLQNELQAVSSFKSLQNCIATFFMSILDFVPLVYPFFLNRVLKGDAGLEYTAAPKQSVQQAMHPLNLVIRDVYEDQQADAIINGGDLSKGSDKHNSV